MLSSPLIIPFLSVGLNSWNAGKEGELPRRRVQKWNSAECNRQEAKRASLCQNSNSDDSGPLAKGGRWPQEAWWNLGLVGIGF
ncbi:hypothetical protein OPQ81_006138 [Rhizoctonia solani]|nr:hypothetical protein OPQ81_006138 [Rhizoctonia solani]